MELKDSVDLKDLLHVIRVRKWLIIIAVLVVTAAAVGVSLLQANVYQGVATILVTEKDTGAALAGAVLNELSAQPERGLATQVQLMQLRPLAERAIRAMNLGITPDDLEKRTTISAVGQTNLVNVTVIDSTAQRAAATANALADGYVEWSRELKRSSITSATTEVEARLAESKLEILDLGKKLNGKDSSGLENDLKSAVSEQQTLVDTLVGLRVDEQNETDPAKLASIRTRISSTERQLSDVRAQILDLGTQLGAASDASNNKELVAQLQIATGLYSTLAQNYETLKVTEQLEVGSGSVVSHAAIDPVRVSPQPTHNGLLGLAVGLVFGLGIAFLAEYLDNTIKSTAEAEEVIGAPVLGNIPAEKMAPGEKRRLTIVERPGSSAAEGYRSLRNSIEFVNFEHDIKTVLITSAAPGEGKSTVAANLAASLAMAGSKVVLVNCDFRRPTTDQFFDVNNQLGLSDVLAGRVPLAAGLQPTGDEKLWVMTPGKMPPNPSELLGSKTMTDLIATLKETYDWVIVDSPPLLAVADAAATARWTDGVLMVTRAGVSTHPAVANARNLLDKVGARILGAVVWGLDESKGGRGGYGGYYGGYYSEYYGATESNGPRSGSKRADSGARHTLNVGSGAGRPREFTMPEERASRWLPRWLVGWKLGLAVFVAVLVVLAAALLVLNGWLGWFAF